jgi:hypothetical protein
VHGAPEGIDIEPARKDSITQHGLSWIKQIVPGVARLINEEKHVIVANPSGVRQNDRLPMAAAARKHITLF